MNDKQRLYEYVLDDLRCAERNMTDLMVAFEEDENLHDMSSVEDRLKAIKSELADWENPSSMFITKGLDR